MSAEAAAERVRMCLAEAGYPRARVRAGEDGQVWVDEWNADPLIDDVPSPVMWRALALGAANPEGDPCLACFDACLFDCRQPPLTLDCGRPR